MAVGEGVKRQDSMKQIKESLPQWCDPQQAQALANLKVSTHVCTNDAHGMCALLKLQPPESVLLALIGM